MDGKQHQPEISAVKYYVILPVVLFLLLLYVKVKKKNKEKGTLEAAVTF